jgi:MFS family permease
MRGAAPAARGDTARRPDVEPGAARATYVLILPFAAAHVLSYLYRNANAVVGPLLREEVALSPSAMGLLTGAYFLGFAVVQIPLGVFLDRVGARRVESVLMLVAAAGAVVFAAGRSVPALAVGRALVGVGVAACLMAPLKLFSQRSGTDRLASISGWMFAAGGLGAVAATAPLEAALHLVTWRQIFVGAAALTVAVAAWIAVVIPDPPRPAARETVGTQLSGLGEVVRSGEFWRVAPLAAAMTGGFLAVQGLWSASWLREVNGLSGAAAADHLAGLNVAMLVTFSVLGVVGDRMAQRGIGPAQLLTGGLGLGLAVLGAIVTQASAHTRLLWIAYGAFSSCGSLVFAQATRGFPASLTGRANTALNVLVLGGAFGLQWGMGVVIDTLRSGGATSVAAHRGAFGALLAVQAAAYAWFVLGGHLARLSSSRTR